MTLTVRFSKKSTVSRPINLSAFNLRTLDIEIVCVRYTESGALETLQKMFKELYPFRV